MIIVGRKVGCEHSAFQACRQSIMFAAQFRRILTSSGSLRANSRIVVGKYIIRSSPSTKRFNSSLPAANSPTPPSGSALGSTKPRLSITFTCAVPNCSHRSTHEFSKDSYERGIVIIQCPSCKNRHLIADHLGWFKDDEATQGGKLRTIEDWMPTKGEKVQRGKISERGVIEYTEE